MFARLQKSFCPTQKFCLGPAVRLSYNVKFRYANRGHLGLTTAIQYCSSHTTRSLRPASTVFCRPSVSQPVRRRYASAVLAIYVSMSVCLSVCPSVTK